jgi:pyruvate formate lyase activating enzyme
MWYDVRCIGARDCLQVCPEEALTLNQSGMQIDRQRCTLCGECVVACPSAALELIGQRWTPQTLMVEILKDQVFFDTSGGGITFSGGEPMQQIDFLVEMLPLCQEANLHVALDTCGTATWQRYERVLPWLDLVLLDLKIMDEECHVQATGVSNQLILDNARRLADSGVALWVRTPVIPGYTQKVDNIRAIGEFIQANMPNIERWDLLAYTNLGKPKYHRLDIPYLLEDTPLLTESEMQALWECAYECVPVARWSGATRKD